MENIEKVYMHTCIYYQDHNRLAGISFVTLFSCGLRDDLIIAVLMANLFR